MIPMGQTSRHYAERVEQTQRAYAAIKADADRRVAVAQEAVDRAVSEQQRWEAQLSEARAAYMRDTK